MGSPATRPISTATFLSNTYTFDPLLASEISPISQSAKIAGSLGVLVRGTVLYGPAVGTPITPSTLLTTNSTGSNVARGILAADIDTTAGPVTALVYTQGRFLDTAMTFSNAGAAADAAQLWDIGCYVLTVEQRSGLLVPMTGLPATGGPLPQASTAKAAAEVTKEQVAAIRAAGLGPAVTPAIAHAQAAWAIAAFGESKPTDEEAKALQASEAAVELQAEQQKALDDLAAKQAKELGDLHKKQADERAAFVKQHTHSEPAHNAPESKAPPAKRP